MRFTIFTWYHIESGLKKLITKGPAFRFDMDDIARIRNDIGTLIKRLEKKYREVKDDEKREKMRSKKAAQSEEPSLDAKVFATGEEPAANESKRALKPGNVDDDLQNTDSEIEIEPLLPMATTGNIETPEIDTVDPMVTSDCERNLKDSQDTGERAAAALADADNTLDTPDPDAIMVDVPSKPDEGETDGGDSEVLLDSSDGEDLPDKTSSPAAKPSSPGSDTEATGRSDNSMCVDASPAASPAKQTEALDDTLSSHKDLPEKTSPPAAKPSSPGSDTDATGRSDNSMCVDASPATSPAKQTEALDDYLSSHTHTHTPTSRSGLAPKAVAPTEKENYPNLETSPSDDDVENQNAHFSRSAQGDENTDFYDV